VLRRVHQTSHHVAIVEVMSDLAGVMMRLGDLIGAQRLLEQTLDSQARLFRGGGNPNSAAVSYNLARALILQGDLMGARRLLERALAGLQTHGVTPVYPIAAAILELLGELDASTDLAAARARYEQALEVRQQLPGTASPEARPEVMQTTARLAQVAVRLGNAEEAAQLLEPILAHVLEATQHELRVGAPEVLFVTADVLTRLGRATSARDLLVGVMEALPRETTDALTLAHGQLALARVYLQLEDLVEARRQAREAHDAFVAVLGRGGPADGEAALLRAEIALRGDEPASAFGLAARALRVFDGKAEPSALELAARALELAARGALGLDRRQTAAALLQRSLERRDAPEVRTALFALLEELAAAESAYDAAPAVALLQRIAPSWLAD